MDIKVCGISLNNNIQWEIMRMRPHGFQLDGNNTNYRPVEGGLASNAEVQALKKISIVLSNSLNKIVRSIVLSDSSSRR